MADITTDPAGPASSGARPRPKASVSLTGQPALVTGANSGIGRAVALALADAGADVAVNYVVDQPAAEDVAHQIERCGRRALAIKADVSNEAEVAAMFTQVIDHFGTLHIAVSNAGLQRDAPLTEMTLAQWTKVIDVNLTGQFLCARETVREFRRRHRACSVGCCWQADLHELSASGDPLGGPRQLCGVERRSDAADAQHAQEVAPFAIRGKVIGAE